MLPFFFKPLSFTFIPDQCIRRCSEPEVLVRHHFFQLSRLCRGLGGIVPAQMLALDEHVGNGPLPGYFQQRALDLRPVLEQIQFDNPRIDVHATEKLLRGLAMRTVSLGEDNHLEREREEFCMSVFCRALQVNSVNVIGSSDTTVDAGEIYGRYEVMTNY